MQSLCLIIIQMGTFFFFVGFSPFSKSFKEESKSCDAVEVNLQLLFRRFKSDSCL